MIQTLLEQCQPRILLAEINPITTFLLAWLVICGYGQPSSADEMAKHRHAIHSGYALNSNNMSEYNEDHYRFQKWGAGLAGWQLDGLKGTNFVGGDTPHNNVPPSLAGYAWRRQQ